MPVVLQLVLDALIGYIWGSIPAGYWMGKLLKGKDFDIRAYGSHKIGATNVLRTLGKVPALIVLIFDLSKGVLPTLLATLVPALQAHIGGDAWGPTAAAIAALVGHIFPVFIGFRGGCDPGYFSVHLPYLRNYYAQHHRHLALRLPRLNCWRPDLYRLRHCLLYHWQA